MKKAIGLFILCLCFCSFRLEAQETASGEWTTPATKQEVLRSIPVVTGAGGSGPARFIPYKNGGKRNPPFPVSTQVAISYPEKAIRKGWEGQTVVAAEIFPDGAVGRTVLAKSSGHEVLDHAAQDAVKTWKFASESENDDAAPQYVDIPVTFKLEDR